MSSDVSLVSRHCTLNYINLVKYIQSQHREEKCLSCAKRLHIWLVMVSKERREEVMRVMTERVRSDVREPFSLTAQILTRSSQVTTCPVCCRMPI